MSTIEKKEPYNNAIEDLILHIIATHPKADNQMLQKKTNISARTVTTKINKLLNLGYISKQKCLNDMRRVYYQVEDE